MASWRGRHRRRGRVVVASSSWRWSLVVVVAVVWWSSAPPRSSFRGRDDAGWRVLGRGTGGAHRRGGRDRLAGRRRGGGGRCGGRVSVQAGRRRRRGARPQEHRRHDDHGGRRAPRAHQHRGAPAPLRRLGVGVVGLLVVVGQRRPRGRRGRRQLRPVRGHPLGRRDGRVHRGVRPVCRGGPDGTGRWVPVCGPAPGALAGVEYPVPAPIAGGPASARAPERSGAAESSGHPFRCLRPGARAARSPTRPRASATARRPSRSRSWGRRPPPPAAELVGHELGHQRDPRRPADQQHRRELSARHPGRATARRSAPTVSSSAGGSSPRTRCGAAAPTPGPRE